MAKSSSEPTKKPGTRNKPSEAPPAPVSTRPAPETVKIVVPSHKRWDLLTTHKAVDVDAVCIPESQLAQYEKHNPGVPFVTHPDSVIGLHAKRNWIYRHFGSVMMFDDDVISVYRSWMGQVSTHKSTLRPREVRDVVNNLFEMAVDAGVYLFGLSPVSTPMAYSPMKPFKLTGTVIGCSYGVRAGSKLYWNEKMISKEDCWISMLNAYHYRFCLIDNRFFTATHEVYIRAGGLSGQRTQANEAADYELLQRTFGHGVLKKREGKVSRFGADTVKSTSAMNYVPQW